MLTRAYLRIVWISTYDCPGHEDKLEENIFILLLLITNEQNVYYVV